MKEFADDNFKFDENGRKFSKRVENTGKRRNCSLRAISPFPTMISRLVLQTRENQGLFGKGLTNDKILDPSKFKTFADNRIDITQKLKFYWEG